MLSSIGRAAVRRSCARASVENKRPIHKVWQLGLFNSSNGRSFLPVSSRVASGPSRFFATATKPAAKPIKRITKPKAKATSTKTTKKPAKKPAKKAAPKKLKPKVKKAKKELTPEEQLAKEVRVLKKQVLTPPKALPSNAWSIIVSEACRPGVRASTSLVEAAARLKQLSIAEREALNHKATQNKTANAAVYKKWVESHTFDEIRAANNARKLLSRKLKRSTKLIQIKDDRQPKHPINQYAYFVKDRMLSGDMKGISNVDALTQFSKEWATVSDAQKKHYLDLAISDKLRYEQEIKTVTQTKA
ncbi:hypothetical protein BJ875DRAFT_22484 [Amylocarpus encephaloides]|uniref:HMG box domain-containing protein n=1 Tax=Amylocarpus encephaloides TaxID=45428 RepID=A0A9P7YIK5_9HELO|nr:hypothetical protein BJ875DRAFT_22484 [Amylocarpus encephaloides]